MVISSPDPLTDPHRRDFATSDHRGWLKTSGKRAVTDVGEDLETLAREHKALLARAHPSVHLVFIFRLLWRHDYGQCACVSGGGRAGAEH